MEEKGRERERGVRLFSFVSRFTCYFVRQNACADNGCIHIATRGPPFIFFHEKSTDRDAGAFFMNSINPGRE